MTKGKLLFIIALIFLLISLGSLGVYLYTKNQPQQEPAKPGDAILMSLQKEIKGKFSDIADTNFVWKPQQDENLSFMLETTESTEIEQISVGYPQSGRMFSQKFTQEAYDKTTAYFENNGFSPDSKNIVKTDFLEQSSYIKGNAACIVKKLPAVGTNFEEIPENREYTIEIACAILEY